MHFWDFFSQIIYFIFGNLVHMARNLNIRYTISMLTFRVNLAVVWILPNHDSYSASF